jgi:Flp pilus assembly protein TadD
VRLTRERMAQIDRVSRTDVPGAIDLALAAKADGLSSALLHHLVAIRLRETGDPEAAIAELGVGLRLEPRNARLMTEVGLCLLDLDRRREAAGVIEVALELDPKSAWTALAYGLAAERLGALDSAETAFRRAAALDPRQADALTGLSGLAVRRREWAAARDWAERSLALDPGQIDALINLARIDLGENRFEPALARLRQVLDLPKLTASGRGTAKLLVGDCLDGLGRREEAFAAYAEGKAELRRQSAHSFGAPDAKTADVAVEEIVTEFEDSPIEGWRAPGGGVSAGGERGHAFLVGFPRSGTTLLELVLATHPDVVALDERPVMLDAEMEFLTEPGGVRRLAGVDPISLGPLREAYWRRVREFGAEPKGKVFVDKHPLSTFRLPLMHKMFPDAKLIFAIRDPRDVVFSCFRRAFNLNAATYEFNTLEGAARLYDTVMRAGEIFMDRLPIEVCRLRYEDLVADFTATAGGVCDFLGVARTDRLKDFAKTAATGRIATPSSAQVARGLYNEGAGYWRNYAFALQPVLPILAPWIEKFGYEPD